MLFFKTHPRLWRAVQFIVHSCKRKITFPTLKFLILTLTIALNFHFAQAQCGAEFELVSIDTCGLITLNSTYDGSTNLTFSWDFGDGTTSTLKTPTHQYTNNGAYNICLAVGDGNGCVDTVCHILEVIVCTSNSCDVEISCNDQVDILFLLDNSGSINTTEFNQMKALTQNTITDIGSQYPNALFSVAHYGGNDGDEVKIQYDFTTQALTPTIIRNTSGNDDMNKALGGIVDALAASPAAPTNPKVSGIFANRRPSAKLFLVIFTDAYPNAPSYGSSMLPFTNSTILKAFPYHANITFIHLEPSITGTQSVGAAIASQGGTYTGSVASNPADPTNPTGPRQFISTNFSTSSIDLLPEFPQCDNEEINFDCSQLTVSQSTLSSDSCCYSIDLGNNIGTEIGLVEAKMLTPGWLFNTGNVSTGFTWASTPTSTLLALKNTGGIPAGANPNALTHCFMPDPVASPLGTTIQVEYRWYCGEGTNKKLVCRDTLTFECGGNQNNSCLDINIQSVTCDPNNPYEYFVNFTVTNNASFTATSIVLQNLDPFFRFKDCSTTSPGGGTSYINIPLGALSPASTSAALCVKILSNHVVLSTENLCFQAGLISPTDCCHSPNEICIDIESCCSPCGEISVVSKPLSIGNTSCCYSLDVVDSCGYQYFTKIETEIITPGVIFGYHALGGLDAGNWYVPSSSPTAITWAPKSGFLPYGTTLDIIQFCLDDIDKPSETPQTILIKYYTTDNNGQDILACTDTLITDCQPPMNNSCLAVYGQNLTCNVDSSCYEYSFWVKNTSSAPFTADWLDAFIYTSGFAFPAPGGTFALTPALAVGDSAYITTCIQPTTFPSTSDSIILSYRLRFSQGDTCCYESLYDTLAVPSCTCCGMNSITPTQNGNCCYSMDVDVACSDLDITKIELEILTPGVIFGAHHTGGANPSDWTNPLSVPKTIQWEHISGTIPTGTYNGLINICLDNVFYASQNPQKVLVKWLTPDSNGMDSIACQDTLFFDCDPPVDNKCLFLKDQQIDCQPDGTYKFSYEVCNVSNPMNQADMLVVFPISPAGATITPTIWNTIIPAGSCYTDSLVIDNVVPGDTVRFMFRLMNTMDTSSWCCIEGDTVEIIIPDCCCQDSAQFFLNIDKGFTITPDTNKLIVDVVPVYNFDSCYTIHWDFDDGNTADTHGSQTVNHVFAQAKKYNICMTVTGPGCGSKEVCMDYDPSGTCKFSNVKFNTGLTPNGDSYNDVLDITGIQYCKNIKLQIFNRWGNRVYEQTNYEDGPQWDGTSSRNVDLPQGTYYYIIDFIDEGQRYTGYLDIRR